VLETMGCGASSSGQAQQTADPSTAVEQHSTSSAPSTQPTAPSDRPSNAQSNAPTSAPTKHALTDSDHKGLVTQRGAATYTHALAGATEEVRRLLAEGTELVEYKTATGSSALLVAAEEGHVDTVQLLVDSKVDVNIADGIGTTALYAAALQGYTDIARLLIESKANVDAAMDNGATALWTSAQQGHIEIARLLVENKANVNAAKENGSTALIVAAQDNHADIAKLLVESNVDVNAAMDNGDTALFIATELQPRGSETMMVLLEGKADMAYTFEQRRVVLERTLMDRARKPAGGSQQGVKPNKFWGLELHEYLTK